MEGGVGGTRASEVGTLGPPGPNEAWLPLASLASDRCLTWQAFLCGCQAGFPFLLSGSDEAYSLWRGENG